jgi:RNA polymerase sigma factor (TIGR02999 family)
MSEITEYLEKVRDGDRDALARVYAILYPELKRLAQARLARMTPGSTLTPTVLVNEAYLRLHIGKGLCPADRQHLMACAARAMRFILVDHARKRHAAKRGDGLAEVTLTDAIAADGGNHTDLLDIDRALDLLEEINPAHRELVELRFFGGLSEGEIAELRGVSTRTVRREWQRARALLHAQIGA